MRKIIIVGSVGILLGYVGSKILFVGSGLSLIPWGLVGLATGIYAKNNQEALVNGALYGFLLSFVFMFIGYSGTVSVFTRIPFFVILGLFGAACGIMLGYIGFLIGKRLKRK